MKTPYYQGLLVAEPVNQTLHAGETDGFRGVAELHDAEFSADVNGANLLRIRDTWNACQGLDLPEGVPPGILKDLVDVAKGLLAQAVHYGPTNPAELGGAHACDLNDKARAILAKLSGK